MNLLLLSEEDFVGHSRAVIRDERVRHVRRVLGKGIGDELRVGRFEGRLGSGRIEQLKPDRLELALTLDSDPPPRLEVDLVLALPRPKFVGRILQAVASMGLERLTLLHSARVQKSYWQSSVLAPESIRRHLRLGLEQGGDTHPPEIEVQRKFGAFVDNELPSRLVHRPGILADCGAVAPFPRQVSLPCTLIIGPEGGFLDREIEALVAAGSQRASLGPRTLRVEVAVAACLSRCLQNPTETRN